MQISYSAPTLEVRGSSPLRVAKINEAVINSLPHLTPKLASVAQLVEQGTENPRVGGSSPPRGTINNASVAQSVEQLICNQQVGGSSPSTSSIWEGSRVAKGSRL